MDLPPAPHVRVMWIHEVCPSSLHGVCPSSLHGVCPSSLHGVCPRSHHAAQVGLQVSQAASQPTMLGQAPIVTLMPAVQQVQPELFIMRERLATVAVTVAVTGRTGQPRYCHLAAAAAGCRMWEGCSSCCCQSLSLYAVQLVQQEGGGDHAMEAPPGSVIPAGSIQRSGVVKHIHQRNTV